VKYLLAMLGGLEISDGIFTDLLVRNGLVQEANPLMESVIMKGDFLLLKIIGVLLCGLILWRLYKSYPRVTVIVTSSIVMFYGAVMVWNLGVFFTV